jgi:S-adenosylmethionine-diacylglycerol 3-amino-3-carboxypropyl transferase
MNKLGMSIWKFEFEARIFISLFIVFVFCLLSWPVFRSAPNNIVLAGSSVGFSAPTSLRIGYLFIALLLLVATLLRMWAGSVLSAPRVMAFRVQHDALITSGPYALVRNPIYLADLIAFCTFALVLEPIALALPAVLFLHYLQLIKYEELSLEDRFGEEYRRYRESAPRFLPNVSGLRQLRITLQTFHVDLKGFRHNALYLLFVPGFVVAAYTGTFLHAFLIGIVGVIDWAILHTRVGTQPQLDAKPTPRRGGVFDGVLYAQCWEDPMIDREALQISADDVVFSITSGGCNLLAFLADDPRKVIALDANPNQNYLLELKMAAFRTLGYEELLAFVGVTPSPERLETYRSLRIQLGEESRLFWDANAELIEGGIIYGGRYERYLLLLRTWLGRLLGTSVFRELFAAESASERNALFEKRWDNFRWHLFTRVLLSRTVMTLLFDKAFFAQLKEDFSFGRHFETLARRAITELPVRENPYLAFILLGSYYSLEHLPAYLQRSNYQKIRERLDRVEIITGSCEDYFAGLPAGSITKFNFSNIFEWMPAGAFEALLEDTIRVAKDGAILTYRNLLVPRSRPKRLSERIVSQEDLAQRLHRRDLSFIYRAYIVEGIVKDHDLPS